jgi:hypothetical protein
VTVGGEQERGKEANEKEEGAGSSERIGTLGSPHRAEPKERQGLR